MLSSLTTGERTVSQLAEPFDMTLAAASKHIRTLERAGLLTRKVRGRTHVLSLEAAPMAEAQRWLRYYERFWTERIDALDRALRNDPSPGDPDNV
jgi:DNA-binding transcriptional ArsR family regulator